MHAEQGTRPSICIKLRIKQKKVLRPLDQHNVFILYKSQKWAKKYKRQTHFSQANRFKNEPKLRDLALKNGKLATPKCARTSGRKFGEFAWRKIWCFRLSD